MREFHYAALREIPTTQTLAGKILKLNSTQINLISMLIAAFSVILATVIGLAALSQAHSIATDSGSFKKAEIKAVIGQAELLHDKNHRIFFGAKKTEMDEGLVIAPFQIGLKNIGDKELTNLYVTFRYNDIFKRDVLENLEYNFSGSIVDGDVHRNFTSSGEMDYVTYHIKSLNPSFAMGLQEPFVLQETRVDDIVEMEGYNIPYTVTFMIGLQLSISSSTIALQDYHIDIGVVSSESMNDLLSKIKKEIIIDEMKNLRSESSFIHYLGILLFNNAEKEAVLIYPETEKMQVDEAIIYHANDKEIKYKTIWYKVATWDRLL